MQPYFLETFSYFGSNYVKTNFRLIQLSVHIKAMSLPEFAAPKATAESVTQYIKCRSKYIMLPRIEILPTSSAMFYKQVQTLI